MQNLKQINKYQYLYVNHLCVADCIATSSGGIQIYFPLFFFKKSLIIFFKKIINFFFSNLWKFYRL